MSDDRTVWYRKWRPQTFSQVSGQDHVTRTLRNAVSGRRLAHAYLLCGPRGTGKTTTARLLAKAVNCTSPLDGEPCDRCESCVAVREGRALDLVEMDAASNRGIDDIRELRDRVGYAASGGRYKVYLIDEVHELTQQAFDALLKTLEEPPPHVIFVLATTDAHRVPATIISRCQRFDLTRARLPDLIGRLREITADEGIEIEDEALQLIGRAATGSFRDAVNLLEQLVASYGTGITAAQARAGLGLTGDARALDLARMAVQGDLAGGLALIAGVRDDGVDLRQFNREVVGRLRALLLLRAGIDETGEADAAAVEAMRQLASSVEIHAVTRALKSFGGADFRAEPQASLPLELALVEVALRAEPEATPAPTFAEAKQARRAQESAPPPASAESSAPVTPVSASAPAAPPVKGAPPRQEPPARTADPADPLATLRERLAAKTADSAATAPPSRSSAPPSEPAAAPNGAASPVPIEHAAPAAAADTAEPAAAEGGATTLSQARSRYRDIYERMQATSRLSASRITMGDVIAIDADTITFGLPHQIQVDRLTAGSEAHRTLVDAVAQVLGRRYAVHCVHVKDVEDRLKAQPTRPSHLLDEAIKLGATPLSGR